MPATSHVPSRPVRLLPCSARASCSCAPLRMHRPLTAAPLLERSLAPSGVELPAARAPVRRPSRPGPPVSACSIPFPRADASCSHPPAALTQRGALQGQHAHLTRVARTRALPPPLLLFLAFHLHVRPPRWASCLLGELPAQRRTDPSGQRGRRHPAGSAPPERRLQPPGWPFPLRWGASTACTRACHSWPSSCVGSGKKPTLGGASASARGAGARA